MSVEDMRYVEKISARKKTPSTAARGPSDDDEPLAARRKSLQADPPRRPPSGVSQPKKGPQIDWFEFFLSAGCDVDDCTRYASSFEKDKIDESILPDITDATMRSLGLREGDIIRVTKAIEKRRPQTDAGNNARQEQLLRDEEYARQLQAEEATGSSARKQPATSPAPNLFAGPGGALKNNTARRGRPQPSKTLPPSAVDLSAIATASNQIQQTGSPQIASPMTTVPSSSSPVQSTQRSSSALTPSSGFDDDAWINRPSSARPSTVTPPSSAARPPSAPAASMPTALSSQSQSAAQGSQPQKSGPSLANATEADIFDQLARLSQLKSNKTSASTVAVSAPPPISTPPASFQTGSGMSQSLQQQQTPQLSQQSIGARGPFAPIPVNQGLLQPLIPTTAAFNTFVPTRIANVTSPFQTQPSQSPSLGQGATGISNQPIMSQATGIPFTGFIAGNPLPINGFGPIPNRKFHSMGSDQTLQILRIRDYRVYSRWWRTRV